MVPLITCEASFGQQVSWLGFGVNKFDSYFGVRVDSVKQPIKSNSVGSGYMCHRRTSAFNDHLHHCFIVLKHVEQAWLRSEKVLRFDNVVHIRQLIILSFSVSLRFGIGVGMFALNLISRRVSPCWNVFRRMQYFYYQVPKIERGYSVHAKTS